MSETLDPVPFALGAINNLSGMIQDMAKLPDGTPRDLDATLVAAVLAAQGQLAIAASLMVVAESIGRRRP